MNLNKKDELNLKRAAVIIGIVLVIWYTCGFGGPKPWAVDLTSALGTNACPDSCWLNVNNDSNDTDGDAESGCPPLYSKMLAADQPVITTGVNACIALGGRSTTTDYEVSCEDDLGRIDCNALALDPNNIRFAYLCHIEGGKYRCQDNWVGCYCPGTGSLPYPNPKECTRVVQWEDFQSTWGKSCAGPCDQGTCTEIEGQCECYTAPPVYTCETLAGTACSQGTCPPGQYCSTNIPMTGCECMEPL